MPPIDATEVVGDKPTALYRLYAADGTLLYVGITHSLSVRFAEHAKEKPWWPEVARKTVAWLGDRAEALVGEAQAIEDENPVHNIIRPLRKRVRDGIDRHSRNPITYRPPAETARWLDEVGERRGLKVRRIVGDAVERARVIDEVGLTAFDRERDCCFAAWHAAMARGEDGTQELAALNAAIEAYRAAIGRWRPPHRD